MMDDNTIDRLLSGDLSKLPSLAKRVVRLFISSTFTDMTLERNTLMERVYPRLKKYCREQHGLDFQVVDMRWGVRDEATDDHQTVNLCSREIQNCQRVSLGPNFIALIGDKYGFRPLLNKIKSSEYRLLRRCLIESDINTDFLDTWYKEDLNAVPPEYLLQPISSILKNFTNRNEPELQMVDQRIWQAIQERLHQLLLIGSSRLVKQGRMSESEQLLKYSISVTEREVLEGCLDISEPKSHCLVYVRSIVDLRDNLVKCMEASQALSGGSGSLTAISGTNADGKDLRRDSATRKASLKIGGDTISLATSNAQTASERKIERTRRLIGRYIDLASKNDEWHIDEDAQKALKDLKETKLTSRLTVNGRNLSNYKVHWNEQDGISSKSEEHKSYLNDLTDHFYGNLTRMVRSAVKAERSKTDTTGLLGEALQHSHYALQVGNSVYARNDELDQIRTYILSGQYQQRRNYLTADSSILPMFIFGVSGSGKTSILARAASAAFTWIEEARKRRRSSASLQASDMLESSSKSQTRRWDRKPCMIMRFCCTTPASSSMVGVLTSVCRQLQYNFYQFGPLNGLMDQDDQQHTSSRLNLAKYDQMPFQQVPRDFVRLVYTFRQLVDNCRHQLHRQRLFVIILDSIERLSSPAENSMEAKYSWLTSITKLPANVRLIVSCSSTGEGCSRLDYAYLKSHFLRAHLGELNRINPNFLHLSSRETSFNSFDSDDESGGESLGFSDSDSSSSHLIHSGPEECRGSGNEFQPTKYSQLIERLVLPAIRRKRGLEPEIQRMHQMNPRQTIKFALETFNPDIDSSPSKESGSRFPGNITKSSYQHEHNVVSGSKRGSNYLGLLHVRPLGKDSAATVLQRWLADSGRNLTQQQWAIVARSFAHCSRPIFVKLALGEVLNWKSYSTQGDTKGLTFGSAWLAEMPMSQLVSATNESIAYGKLVEIVQASLASESSEEGEEEEAKFRWQMLAMEQQWLNFLDYKSRQQKQTASMSAEPQGQEEKANLVIRIAGSGSVATTALEQGQSISSGSAANTSSTSMSICHLSNTIEDAINQLFARIELQHGYLLTKHSLSYITAARNGICENELEDILSLDDVVLDDVFQYHLPPVRRIPPLLWTRIRNDLPDYLSERDADGIVVTWHHSQFKTVTEKRYLEDNKQVVYIHSLMADYFLGKWAGKAKPFTCTKQQIQMAAEQLESAVQQSARGSGSAQQGSSLMGTKRGSGRLESGSVRVGTSFSVRNRLRSSDQYDQRLQWMQAKAHRQVPHQPLYYDSNATSGARNIAARHGESPSEELSISVANQSEDKSASTNLTSKRYNLRKLTELPYHLLRAGRYNELATCVLFNYKWLFASIEALSLQSLFADFQETLECLRNKLLECKSRESSDTMNNQAQLELQTNDCVPSDELHEHAIRSMIEQIELLSNTLRLSSSVIQSEPQMLAPQLIGRLLSVVDRLRQKLTEEAKVVAGKEGLKQQITGSAKQPMLLSQLMHQCDRDGCADCALLPIDHCLQSPDGLQLSSLEGHPFAVMSMVLTSDQRHLLAVSSKFVMWNISTGEIAREIDHNIKGAIMEELKMGSNNQLAIAYTSDNHILVLDILTQQIAKSNRLLDITPIGGLKLVDQLGARRFLVWTRSNLFVFSLKIQNDSLNTGNSRSFGQGDSNAILIELDYEIDLSKKNSALATKILLDVEVAQLDDGSELIHCTCGDQGDDKLCLSVYMIGQGGGSQSIKLWNYELEAVCLVLSPSGNQIFYSNQNGDIFLRRRRAKSWSSPKLIYGASSDDRVGYSTIMKNIMASDVIRAPLALEVENPDSNAGEAQLALQVSGKELDDLRRFERQVDKMLEEDEIECPSIFSKGLSEQAENHCKTQATGVNFVKVHWPNRIDVIKLKKCRERKGYSRSSLVLPKDVRNVRIERNKCQLISVIMQVSVKNDTHFLIVASGKHLLVYSIDEENLLRSMDAHASRITKLLPIKQSNALSGGSSYRFSIASSSLDKTVKIWNLLNIANESESIDKLLGGQVEDMQICSQRPIVACLSKGRLSILDWRTMKIVASYESGYDIDTALVSDMSKPSPLLKSKFSSNGRYLAAATQDTVYILIIEGALKKSTTGRLTQNSLHTTELAKFKLVAKYSLPTAGPVVGLKFLSQDTRILTMVRCFNRDRKLSGSRSSSRTSMDSMKESTVDEKSQMNQCIRVFCFGLADSKLQYDFECQVFPAKELSSLARQMSRSKDKLVQQDWHQANRNKLVALTRDQHFIVTVSCAPSSIRSASRASSRRQSSAASRTPLTLNVYSTRDGSMTKTIDLLQLQKIDQQDVCNASQRAENLLLSSSMKSELQVQSPVPKRQPSPASSVASRGTQEFVSIFSDQFNRIKSIRNRDRQTLVALLDDERGTSYMIDIANKCLICSSNEWNCASLSSEGTYGLSHIFSSTGRRNFASHATSIDPVNSSSPGLKLLSMRRCQTVKTILDAEQINKLSSSSELQSTGANEKVLCGFTRPNDGYVYYCDSRLKRILLIRLRDNQLIANYKLTNSVTQVKCAQDGFALVLAQLDGSLTSLAIVDPQASDTFTLLAQYPSRKRPL